MKGVIRIIANVLYVLSFCGVILAGVLGAIYELIGHAKFEQMLSSLGVSNGFKRFWIFSIIMLLFLVITRFIKVKLSL